MNVITTIRNFETSQASRENIENIVTTKLDKFVQDENVKVTVTKEARTFKTTISLRYNETNIRGEAVEINKLPSINRAIDDAVRKLRKAKTRSIASIRDNKGICENDADWDVAYDRLPQISRIKERSIETLTDNEAIFKSEMLGHNFFVYNADDGNTCALYKRRDNTYGKLIFA